MLRVGFEDCHDIAPRVCRLMTVLSTREYCDTSDSHDGSSSYLVAQS